MSSPPQRIPRGRHAPPREVREEVQRLRLLRGAVEVFVAQGYGDASAEAISRAAGMSKATFYEHFANKKACILALMDEAGGRALERIVEAARGAGDDPLERHLAGMRAFLEIVGEEPDAARAFLIVSVGAGPEALERRDVIVEGIAQTMYREAREGVERRGGGQRFAAVEDALAIVGAMLELISRQLRTGQPGDLREVADVVERLLRGVLVDPAT